MRHRLLTIGLLVLLVALVALGLSGCARQAPEREAQTAEAGDQGRAGSAGDTGSPAAGETVVSAVTPTQQTAGSQPTPTLVPVGGTQPPAEATVAPAAGEATAEPPPSGSQPPPSESGAIWHTVQPGETLSSIARRYGTTWQAIAQANGLSNPNQIYEGQKLKIPTTGGSSGGTTTGCRIQHTVKQGEWVWQIARNYGVDPYDILAANGLTIQSANTIYAGMVLCIP